MSNSINLERLNKEFFAWFHVFFKVDRSGSGWIISLVNGVQNLFNGKKFYVYEGSFKELNGVWGIRPLNANGLFYPAISIGKFLRTDEFGKEKFFRIVAVDEKFDFSYLIDQDDLWDINSKNYYYEKKDLNIYGWLELVEKKIYDFIDKEKEVENV